MKDGEAGRGEHGVREGVKGKGEYRGRDMKEGRQVGESME